MEIIQENNEKKGVFYAKENDKQIGEMTYVWAGNKIIIDHTEVDLAYKGKGIGYDLVQKAVDFAREKSIKIMPLCPFAKAVFDKKPEYADVLF
ncbi:GNAT family N-acetyltransferase [Polluticaenibacter yanchengensis]